MAGVRAAICCTLSAALGLATVIKKSWPLSFPGYKPFSKLFIRWPGLMQTSALFVVLAINAEFLAHNFTRLNKAVGRRCHACPQAVDEDEAPPAPAKVSFR